jgi:DNA-binding response OmpR family regulator
MHADATVYSGPRQKPPSTASLEPTRAGSDSLTRVLIIEDDSDIVDLLTRHFNTAGRFSILTAMDGASGLDKAREQMPDIIVLDLMLPNMPGLEVCKTLKGQRLTKDIPILVLTAKADVIDRIVALELGADDYVTKPFSPREVMLRVNAILRRSNGGEKEASVTIGAVTIDTRTHSVLVYGNPIQLTTVEFKLLSHLMYRSGRVQPRDRLLTEVWGYEQAVDTRTIDTHVQRLRRKLGKAGMFIETIRGFGYRFTGE